MAFSGGTRARHGAGIASVALHVLLAGAVVRIVPSPAVPEPTGVDAIEVAIESGALPAAEPAPAVPEAAAPATQRADRPPDRAPVARARAHAHAGEVVASAGAAIVTTTVPDGVPAPAAEPGTAGRECAPGEGGFIVPIDPRSVAVRALVDEADAGAGGTVAAGPGGRGSRRDGRQDDLEQSLRGSVRGPELSRRPPPVIRPSADGGYDVEANRLSAHIARDGTLSFRDGPPIEDPHLGAIPANRETGFPGAIGAGFRFDLNDGIFEAAGEDPLRTERQWVLRETEELRNRLATRARRVAEEQGLLVLAERLREIAADPRLSPAARRSAIFEIWDDCATDAIGERARTMVEQFVRERFPAGSALAYTEAELVRFNRHRVTGRPFDPYRGAPDAGPVDGGA